MDGDVCRKEFNTIPNMYLDGGCVKLRLENRINVSHFMIDVVL